MQQILKMLRPDQLKQLEYALNQEITLIVDIPLSGYWIGVNVQSSDDLEILETKGVWSYGRRRNEIPKRVEAD